MNCETRALLEYWDFCAKDVNEACDFLDWLACDTYEFETSCSNSCTPPSFIPNYAPHMCEICHFSDTIVILVFVIFLMIVLLNYPV